MKSNERKFFFFFSFGANRKLWLANKPCEPEPKKKKNLKKLLKKNFSLKDIKHEKPN